MIYIFLNNTHWTQPQCKQYLSHTTQNGKTKIMNIPKCCIETVIIACNQMKPLAAKQLELTEQMTYNFTAITHGILRDKSDWLHRLSFKILAVHEILPLWHIFQLAKTYIKK